MLSDEKQKERGDTQESKQSKMIPLTSFAGFLFSDSAQPLRDRNLGQVHILHDGPHNGQATGFCRESVYL
ncbi:MAG TPA: hypothetical protein VGN34_34320, partial [Ktedonobacteraceae bacterium]